jgi:hypothetical protein
LTFAEGKNEEEENLFYVKEMGKSSEREMMIVRINKGDSKINTEERRVNVRKFKIITPLNFQRPLLK